MPVDKMSVTHRQNAVTGRTKDVRFKAYSHCARRRPSMRAVRMITTSVDARRRPSTRVRWVLYWLATVADASRRVQNRAGFDFGDVDGRSGKAPVQINVFDTSRRRTSTAVDARSENAPLEPSRSRRANII